MTRYDKDILARRESKPHCLRTTYTAECRNVLVGFEKKNHSLPLLKFCYGILCGKSNLIYQGSYQDNQDTKIAVSPHLEESFMPFCNYTEVGKDWNDWIDEESEPHEHLFCSNNPGWSQGFWNASVCFFHVAKFLTLVFPQKNSSILRVEQKANYYACF